VLLLVIGEPQKDLFILDAVHVDRHHIQPFEFRNVFERYWKFDIHEVQHSCNADKTILAPYTFHYRATTDHAKHALSVVQTLISTRFVAISRGTSM